jgi:ABC-2 type transport system ATP-binding protein
MSQRLGLAAALLGNPPVLILDEPTNGLDPEGMAWLREVLKELASQGRTVLVSSHLMAEMAQTAKHMMVIGRGGLLADCPTSEMPTFAGLPTLVKLRSDNAGKLAEGLVGAGTLGSAEMTGEPPEPGTVIVTGVDPATIAALAASLGVVLTELAEQPPSLEEAYLALTAPWTDHIGATGKKPAEVKL